MSIELSLAKRGELSRCLEVVYVLNVLNELYDQIVAEVENTKNPKGPVKFHEIPSTTSSTCRKTSFLR